MVAGAALALFGLLLWAGARAGLGRLPGDIFIERDGVHISVPIVTSLLLSVVLTIVLNVVLRVWR